MADIIGENPEFRTSGDMEGQADDRVSIGENPEFMTSGDMDKPAGKHQIGNKNTEFMTSGDMEGQADDAHLGNTGGDVSPSDQSDFQATMIFFIIQPHVSRNIIKSSRGKQHTSYYTDYIQYA